MLGRFIRRHKIVVPLALISLALLSLGGVMQAQAGKKHSHKVKMVYKSGEKTLQAGGVDFILLFCPNGTRITGTGSDTNGLAYVNAQDIDPSTDSGSVFYVDDFGSQSKIEAQIACVKKKTSSVRTKLSTTAASSEERQAALQAAREKRDQLQARLNQVH
jgi:hypothetical protein